MRYYHLFPTTRNPASPDPAWLAEARASLMCSGCGSLPRTGKVPDVVVQRNPDKSAINVVYGVYICYALTSLLDTLCQGEFVPFFQLGRLLNSDKEVVPDVRTFMCHRTVLVRGNEKSTFRLCPVCHRLLYCAVGKRYLVRRHTAGIVIAEDEGGGLVVNELVAGRLSARGWKNLGLKKLELCDEPIDGLNIA